MRFHHFTFLLAIAAIGAVVACSPSRHRVGNQAMLVANADKPYAACLDHCRQISKYDITLEACERACNDARKDFPYLDKSYSSYERCAKDMDNLDLNRLDIVSEAQQSCEDQYEHLHKRYGCKEGVAAYYNAATMSNVCGGYTALEVAPQTLRTPQTVAPPANNPAPVITPFVAPVAQPAPAPVPVPVPVPQG